MSPTRLVGVLCCCLFSFQLVPPSRAQLPPNSDTTSAPIPGAGHDYLHGPQETVNPANGSLSTYDAESQIKTANGVTYLYDGSGCRVAKATDAVPPVPTKLYWCGSGGEILAETDASGNTLNEYIFFGGKRIAVVSATGGESLPVQNPSFEVADAWTYQACNGTCFWNNGPIPGWTITGSQGAGSLQPGSGPPFYNAPLPDGNIVAWSNGATISQTLTGVGLQPNTTYTLSAYIGHRLDDNAANYSVSLLAGSTTLNTISGSNSTIPLGQFAKVSLTYTTGSTVTPGDLSIQLTSSALQVGFDAISLTTSGGIYYYVEDLLGTSRVMTTATGAVCYDGDFDPYGSEHTYTDTCPQNYEFEGKERDTETGNDDFGARYYTSRFGRWLSADWSSVPVAVPYANLTNPQTLNLYSMVADDPESFADLDGHCDANDWCGSVAGVAMGTLKFVGHAVEGAVVSSIPVYGSYKAAEGITNSVATAAQDYYEKGVSGVANQLLDQGREGATEIVTEAVLTGGLGATAKVDGVTPESWGAPDSNVVVRGGQGEMPPQGTKFSGAQGATVEDAAQGVPHGTIRESTAGKIRESGGSVRSKPELTRKGNLNEKHVDVREGTKKPSTFSDPKPNPVPKNDRIE